MALECLVLKKRSRHRSFNEGWSDGIDANLVGGEVKRHCLAEAFDCPFGRTIERPAGTPDMPHLGRHVDDRATATSFHHSPPHNLSDAECHPAIKGAHCGEARKSVVQGKGGEGRGK